MHGISGPAEADILLISVLCIVFGVINCFWGYRIFKLLLSLWGFFTGCSLGIMVAENFQLLFPWNIIIGVVLGIIAIFIVRMLFQAGMFLLGAVFGYTVAMAILYNWYTLPQIPVIIISCLVGGIAAVILQKPILVVATSFAGSWLAVSSGITLISGQPFGSLPPSSQQATGEMLMVTLGWIVLGTVGMLMQLKGKRRRRLKLKP